ncbi:hypothetical protein L249_0237 [Ophiocordyceps polyrhachis-furcata BCC 54312]|uniref:Spc7 kinetochore protein domain-containing protein n=1 Tax=Ophiocordyceps polyrhachis-furcata BCC 54312 TaxID=1330021 RepID=A0A367LFI6_9HYPO|nr:hypothetical protein L249_0237 [Ophiocordyceps polyrhachis-furcata BCC 54312]
MFPTTNSASLPTRRSRISMGATSDVRNTMDRDNLTLNLGSSRATSRKSRSKSMGPGGLEALKQINGNRRASLAAPVKLPRSILKPTIPSLSANHSLKNGKNKTKQNSPDGQDSSRSLTSSSEEDLAASTAADRTEEEKQADTREREERERRDARRKSLANRRVSFAAEATLHTFHEIEYLQDSTTSTDSTRRASSVADKTAGRSAAADGQEDTPKVQTDNAAFSPEKLADPNQQRRRRRSSGIQPVNASGPDNDTVASTAYSSDSEPADVVEDMGEEEDERSSSDSDDGTMMTIDMEEMTGTSVASDRSTAADDDSTLDEALRIAARRAGTQNLESDNGNEEDDDGEEVIPLFGWAKKNIQPVDEPKTLQSANEPSPDGDADIGVNMDLDMDVDTDVDMEMTHAVGRILKPTNEPEDLLGDVSMEVTQALGGILSHNNAPRFSNHQGQVDSEEATMEFTAALGGIHAVETEDTDDVLDDEDMSMELTAVVGDVLSRSKEQNAATGRPKEASQTEEPALDDSPTDATSDMDKLMDAAEPDGEAGGDATLDMDMTAALGGIVESGEESQRSVNKRIMEEEVNRPNDAAQDIVEAVARSPTRRAVEERQAVEKAPAESPGLSAFRGKGLRRSTERRASATPKRDVRSRTPSPVKPAVKSGTPSPVKSTTKPAKASPVKTATPQRRPASSSKNQTQRSASSPARRISERPTKTPSPAKAARDLFRNDPQTGDRTPHVVLTPPHRALSGLGIDRPGLGSPKVSALCNRRGSIGDSASEFVLGKRTVVTFEEPKKIEQEVDRMRREEEDKEDPVKMLEREADGCQEERDATFNLREMINSLSPKWKPVRGRKSLHVGSAKGLLGKRPAELDEDDQGEDDDGVKRLKGHQSSPVKNVLLEQPDVGRLTRSARKSVEQQAKMDTSSPVKKPARRSSGRFKDVGDSQMVDEIKLDEVDVGKDVEEDKIHLQDFLNMISIRFMELNTTKRRQTTVAGSGADGSTTEGQDGLSLERCVVAGACTVPMLELYQHSCRELKKYISEGRRMVKEIEKETLEENPPLFREYMSASADVKALMDHQFKNVKTHARLLSKAMWYEWRMKLQEGLREGLVNIGEGMEKDDKVLREQQDVVESVLPDVKARYESLQEESGRLQDAARELADCDADELASAREELVNLDADVAAKKQQIAELRRQLEDSSVQVQELTWRKTECLQAMEACDRTREKYRGWSSREVQALKARVEAIEKKHGWAISGLSGGRLVMTYRRELELLVDVSSLRAVDVRLGRQQQLAKEFMLHCIREQVKTQDQLSELLRMVASGWDQALMVTRQINRINTTFPTAVTKRSDSSISVTSRLLLVPLKTLVEIELRLDGGRGGVAVSVVARVVYGEPFNVGKMGEFMAARIGNRVGGEEDWSDALLELQRRLIAKGSKMRA